MLRSTNWLTFACYTTLLFTKCKIYKGKAQLKKVVGYAKCIDKLYNPIDSSSLKLIIL